MVRLKMTGFDMELPQFTLKYILLILIDHNTINQRPYTLGTPSNLRTYNV